MDETVTIKTIRDARPGDKVWLCRYTYRHQPSWSVAEVAGTTRQSIILQSRHGRGEKFDIETGRGRPVRGYTSDALVAGIEDRWRIAFGTFEMARAVEAAYRAADLETMREVCRLLGVKAPIGWGEG